MSVDAKEESILGFAVVDTLKLSDDTTKNTSLQERGEPENKQSSDKINVTDSDHPSEDTKKEELNEENEEGEVIELEQGKSNDAYRDNITISSEERFDISIDDEPIVLSAADISSTKTVHAEEKRIPRKWKREDKINYVWVSNISRHIKASDLKKLFSNVGKVSTAKILTNGKSFYGYVSMDTPDLAMKSIRELDQTQFEGKLIQVSRERPDLKEVKEIAKEDIKSRSHGHNNSEFQEKKPSRSNSIALDEKSKIEISNLRNKLDSTYSDVIRLKRKLEQYERRHEGMRKKCSDLEHDLQRIRNENRAERRRLNQEKEEFEKSKKLQEIRFDADKAIINKELSEVKKLRENLKIKLDELKVSVKKPAKRSRSPIMRNVRSPARSNSNRYRTEDRPEKRSKREDFPRNRTPPPPPSKLPEARKRSGINAPGRHYYSEGEERSISGGTNQYEFRRKQPFQMAEVSRGSNWSASYSKDPRRPNIHQTLPAPSNINYSIDNRFGYQQPPTTLVGIPRGSHNAHYINEYDKTYVHY